MNTEPHDNAARHTIVTPVTAKGIEDAMASLVPDAGRHSDDLVCSDRDVPLRLRCDTVSALQQGDRLRAGLGLHTDAQR